MRTEDRGLGATPVSFRVKVHRQSSVRDWQESHPEKLKAYRKTMIMKRAIEKRRFPQPSSIQRHALTEVEVVQLVEGVLASLRKTSALEADCALKPGLERAFRTRTHQHVAQV